MSLDSVCIKQIATIPIGFSGEIDYIDISSVSNLDKKIIAHQTMNAKVAPSRARQLIQKGDVLVSTVRPNLNAVAIVEKDTDNQLVASTGYCVLRCSSKIDERYLFNFCQSPRFVDTLTRQATGASYPAVSNSIVRSVHILLPSIDEQRSIASLLDNVSHLITLRRQQLAKLAELVKARFVEMFGDVIRNEKGWSQRLFCEIASSRLGKMLDTKQETGKHSYPYLANFNVQWFRFELKNLNQMDFDEDDQIEFALQDGDLLVCEGGEIGRCAVWHNEIQPCFFQKALHRVRCDRSVVLPDYLAWWFKYNCEHSGFSAIEGAKATIAHLPGTKLKNLIVTVPSVSMQEEFVAFVEQTDKSKLTIQQSLVKLDMIKQALMQKYFG